MHHGKCLLVFIWQNDFCFAKNRFEVVQINHLSLLLSLSLSQDEEELRRLEEEEAQAQGTTVDPTKEDEAMQEDSGSQT